MATPATEATDATVATARPARSSRRPSPVTAGRGTIGTVARGLGVLLVLLAVSGVSAPLLAATVAGRVEDLSGTPIAGARITIFQPDLSTFYEARTNAAGEYTVAPVAPGSYRLGVAAPGFEYDEVAVEVSGSSAAVSRDFVLDIERHPGRWSVVGNTLPDFLDATDIAALTPDGKIFYCHSTDDPVLFDPVTGTKTFPLGSGEPQGCMNGTLLDDGSVFFAGGQTPADPGSFRNAVRWVKTFSFEKNSWTRLDDLLHASGRWYPGLARLADGSLLVMGGGTRPTAARTDTCEVFDASTRTWRPTGPLVNPSEYSPTALLYTGQVLATWWPPQLYDPSTGTWRLTGNFRQPERGWPGHSDHSIVVLEDGRVLALGIRSAGANEAAMGEVFDPATEAWSLTSSPGLLRHQTEVVALPDGKVLVAGGETGDPEPPVDDVFGVVRWCDIYDPLADRWRRVADMLQFREYHAVTLLVPDGRVLTTGGTMIQFRVGPTSADIEAYEPPYIFRGVRPRIESISSAKLARGSRLGFTVFPETSITSAVLMGAETTTHWVNGGVPRRLVLEVEQAGCSASAVLPEDPNRLPLGFYLFFAMVDDIPSVARIVQVVAALPPDGFRRGDSNQDGVLDISDPLFTLGRLFLGGGEVPCLDAADANDDGTLDISDAVFALLGLFSEGRPPPPPFPDCGEDPTADGLACANPGCEIEP